MQNKIVELREKAVTLLSKGNSDEEARNKWEENVRDLLQEMSIYHTDIEYQNTSLESSEHDLVESHANYTELFEEAPVGYVVVDREMNIKLANRTFCEMVMSTYSGDNTASVHSFVDLVCPEYRDDFKRFVEMLSHSGSIQSIEIKILDHDGQPRYVVISAGKRKLSDNFFRLTVSDINFHKKIEMRFLTTRLEEEENNKKKMLFLTDVSHELRTPLATLSGFCEMMSGADSDPMLRHQYLQSMQNAVQSMRILADEIRNVSFLKSGAFPLRNIEVDVATICREQVLLAQNLSQDKNLSIHCELSEIPILSGDPIRLGMIIHFALMQAISNSFQGEIQLIGKYDQNERGLGTLTIEISGHHIFSEIQENREKMNSNILLCNCCGIGPFLGQQVLKVMKGQMKCTSDLLHLEIPFLKSLNTVVPDLINLEINSENGPKTCLLIDDIMMNLKVLAALMRKMNCIPVLASSAKEALQLLARTNVDLIMTDLWMPEMNGMEFAMMVRQMKEYDNIPIVAVTADVERSQNFDMRYFSETLIKPVSLSMLKEKLIPIYKRDNKGGKTYE